MYRLASNMQLLLFFFVGVFAWRPRELLPQPLAQFSVRANEWPTFFTLPALFLLIITLLTYVPLLAVTFDRVDPCPRQSVLGVTYLSNYQAEAKRVRFLVVSVLGMVGFGGSLLLLYAALESWRPGSWFQSLQITPPGQGLQYGK